MPTATTEVAPLPEMDEYYDSLNISQHEFSAVDCCHQHFISIIQQEGINSEALDVFNPTETPIGSEKWRLVDAFCNQSRFGEHYNDCSGLIMPEHTLLDMNHYTRAVNGFVIPSIGIVTLITNILVCIVLLEKNMRNPTNIMLVFMAICDTLTGVFPIPAYIYTYFFDNWQEWLSCGWVRATKYTTLILPTISHTASIWLTVALAVERYVILWRSLNFQPLCSITTILQVIGTIHVFAIALHSVRFVESCYEAVAVPSIIRPWQNVQGCYEIQAEFVRNNEDLYGLAYWGIRVFVVHVVPCVTLVVVNVLLIVTLKAAVIRRQQLVRLNRSSESRRIKETNQMTMMLCAVVTLFLVVEVPLAIFLVLYILQASLPYVFNNLSNHFSVATPFLNLCILLSYPCNFFIYCFMSKQFRDTFSKIFMRDAAVVVDSLYTPLTELGNNQLPSTVTERLRTGSAQTTDIAL